MSRRWPPILLVGIAACAWIIPRVPVAQVDPVRDFLAQGSETQTVLIDVDRIGAVIRDSAIEEFQQVTQGIAERHRLTVDRRVNDE